jgi:D-serine deaminase-like pyridoxal phosphate-dependent protein
MHSPGGEVPPSREPADDPSSIVGRPISELDTPALCVDLDTMEGLRIGDRIEFSVGYCETTIHLHRSIVGVRGGVFECVWPIAADTAPT